MIIELEMSFSLGFRDHKLTNIQGLVVSTRIYQQEEVMMFIIWYTSIELLYIKTIYQSLSELGKINQSYSLLATPNLQFLLAFYLKIYLLKYGFQKL